MSTLNTFTADCARTISESDPIVYNEIDFIMRAIIDASNNGNYEVEIDGNTYMTEGVTFTIDYTANPVTITKDETGSSGISAKYYDVWRDDIEDRKAQIQLNSVVKYFRNLGFNIYIRQNEDTNKIKWVINW